MRNKLPYFLWPKVQFNFLSLFRNDSINKLENLLHEMFPSGHPVVCSSGRVAMFIAIRESKLARKDTIKMFPYSSHCVQSTISRITNPIPYSNKSNMDIIYHQWGINYDCNYTPKIEDSVDSLYELNSRLFYLGSKFEIWSFPKILGVSSGGVLWCKNEAEAKSIREKINHKKGILFSWFLRILSYKHPFFHELWEGTEKGYKGLSRIQRSEIFLGINKWEQLVANRKEKLKQLSKEKNLNLPLFKGRLPSCLPITTSISEKELIELGFSTGKRHFLNERNIKKVFPLPIHQDTSISFLRKAIKKIQSNANDLYWDCSK